jgi:hypothetical protein
MLHYQESTILVYLISVDQLSTKPNLPASTNLGPIEEDLMHSTCGSAADYLTRQPRSFLRNGQKALLACYNFQANFIISSMSRGVVTPQTLV